MVEKEILIGDLDLEQKGVEQVGLSLLVALIRPEPPAGHCAQRNKFSKHSPRPQGSGAICQHISSKIFTRCLLGSEYCSRCSDRVHTLACAHAHTHTHTPCTHHTRPRASVLKPQSTKEANMKLDSGVRQLLFSCSVMSDSLRPHGLQHTRLPCPSLSPRLCSNLCPSNR